MSAFAVSAAVPAFASPQVSSRATRGAKARAVRSAPFAARRTLRTHAAAEAPAETPATASTVRDSPSCPKCHDVGAV
jgi:hypothetical protein